MLKVGVLGAGHLGKIHLKLLKEIEGIEVVGFFDPDDENASKVEEDMGVKRYEDIQDLVSRVNAVDIVTPTLSHFDCAMMSIKMGKHIFIEKPMTSNMEEAKQLLDIAAEADTVVQVGHIERFNPAFTAIDLADYNPMFIETHRLAQFNPRGTDVSVILDLMIHDIDIILKIVKARVKKISASGVPVISSTPDIANARIEFDNGCVANVTASRISVKNMRKMRIFQSDAYLSIDFLEKKTEVVKLSDEAKNGDTPSIQLDLGLDQPKKYIQFSSPEIQEVNALKTELETWKDAIENDTEPLVTVEDGYHAMEVAYEVMEKINRNLGEMSAHHLQS